MDVLAFLTLDIQRPNISAIVYGMQGDRQSRAIRAQLVDGSTQWTPPAGTFFVISYAKPDGTHGMYSQTETGNAAVTVSGSVATIALAEQVLTVAGDVPMTLTMFSADGERLSAFTWLLIVKPAAYSDAAFMSTDYYNLLTEQIAAVLKAQESIVGLTATATTLAPGSAATVTVTGGTGADDPYNFELGIPRGNTGAQGETGAAAEITAQIVEYQAGTSGTTAPTGVWSTTVPAVPAGQYLWTRSTITFNSGSPVISYSVSRMGIDGSGSVTSVNNQSPDDNGNITVTASDIQMSDNRSVEKAIESAGAVNSVNHIYPDSSKDVFLTAENIPTTEYSSIESALNTKANITAVGIKNLLDNCDFKIAQAGYGGKHGAIDYGADRWILDSGTVAEVAGKLKLSGTVRQVLSETPSGTVSLFVTMVSGNATISFADGEVTISSNGGVLDYAEAYEGTYTASTKPIYSSPSPTVELLKCQRYYVETHASTNLYGVIAGLALTGTRIQGASFPVQMRATPNIILMNPKTGHSGCVADWSTDADITASAVYVNNERFVINCNNNGPVYYRYIATADL